MFSPSIVVILLAFFIAPQQGWSDEPPADAEMARIPAGKYKIEFKTDQALSECAKHNDPCKKKWFEDEEPVHTIYLDSFLMGGNVYEWVFDWYARQYYGNSPAKNPTGPSTGRHKVMRGGSWINYPVGTRPTDRTNAKPDKRLNFVGFRCAK
jgi:formylglycine-generating enzyme required for sulfatase activity